MVWVANIFFLEYTLCSDLAYGDFCVVSFFSLFMVSGFLLMIRKNLFPLKVLKEVTYIFFNYFNGFFKIYFCDKIYIT